jgi:TldD protein
VRLELDIPSDEQLLASAITILIAGVERGIYLHQLESGMEDPMGWGIQVTAHYGEEIRNGQLTGRLYTPSP